MFMNIKIDAKGQLVGYIRVSTLMQNTDRQEDQLKQFNLDALFVDHASGKDVDRPELQAALRHLRLGDTFIVHSMDRLARNLDDLRTIVKDLNNKGVAVKFIKESLLFDGTNSPMSILLLSMMGAFAEFERALIRERQKEGIAIAKSKGLYKGRKKVLTEIGLKDLVNKDRQNNHKNRSELAREVGISRQSLYNYLKKSNIC
jgi:DNA invertase Pin-like site-specific DNA recombinase